MMPIKSHFDQTIRSPFSLCSVLFSFQINYGDSITARFQQNSYQTELHFSKLLLLLLFHIAVVAALNQTTFIISRAADLLSHVTDSIMLTSVLKYANISTNGFNTYTRNDMLNISQKQ